MEPPGNVADRGGLWEAASRRSATPMAGNGHAQSASGSCRGDEPRKSHFTPPLRLFATSSNSSPPGTTPSATLPAPCAPQRGPEPCAPVSTNRAPSCGLCRPCKRSVRPSAWTSIKPLTLPLPPCLDLLFSHSSHPFSSSLSHALSPPRHPTLAVIQR